ncbi:MAG TPA: hypothetical protein VMF06_18385 [Candidatus Limnocylindria bacterium]|jgi:hypothetical protein|nr:hypothetical protein [Candidatus Limnocylindria bacterium]
MKILLLPVCLIALVGCQSVPDVSHATSGEISQNSEVERDTYRKTVTVQSPKIHFGNTRNVAWNSTCQLIAQKHEGGTTTYSLLIITTRSHTHNAAVWNHATDQKGRRFPLEKESSEVVSLGAHQEVVSMDLDRTYLDGMRAADTTLRIDGVADSDQIVITANVVDGFLHRVDGELASR